MASVPPGQRPSRTQGEAGVAECDRSRVRSRQPSAPSFWGKICQKVALPQAALHNPPLRKGSSSPGSVSQFLNEVDPKSARLEGGGFVSTAIEPNVFWSLPANGLLQSPKGRSLEGVTRFLPFLPSSPGKLYLEKSMYSWLQIEQRSAVWKNPRAIQTDSRRW